MELTDEQAAFVDYYFLYGANATEAARHAGYSPRTARQQGSRLLTNVYIRAEIERRMAERALSASEVLWRLSMIARGNLGDFIDTDTPTGRLNLTKAAELHQLHLIRRISWTRGATNIELYDALRALEIIGRYYGLWTGKVQVGLTADEWEYRYMDDDERLTRLNELLDRARARQEAQVGDSADQDEGDGRAGKKIV